MVKIKYNNLRVLIADDFSNFRNTVFGMLSELGVVSIDMASNCDEIVELCSQNRYKLILCDYNLGSGRNGQHVLEELRYRKFLKPSDIFILVSAESSRNIVMSAYDCTPDDYLMKPITTQMLHTRLERILLQRIALGHVYNAIEAGDNTKAIEMLIEISLAENRYSTPAQKLLGEIFIQEKELNKAEKLYRRALEVRELDWARLGMAKVKHLKGEHETAGDWLEKIIEDNYLYLPAYDVLAENWNQIGDKQKAQAVVERSVEVSPMSILRQKKLAQLANENGDFETSLGALRKAVKLGKQSCYGTADDIFQLARTLGDAIEMNEAEIAPSIVQEVLAQLDAVGEQFELSGDALVQNNLNKSRLCALVGDEQAAKDHLNAATDALDVDLLDIDAAIDHIRVLKALGENDAIKALLVELQLRFAGDQEALEKLDEFLDEPASESNKALVASVNREGIELYNDGQFDNALECFEQVRGMFPLHVGLQLNIVQALIGKLKGDPDNVETQKRCRDSLMTVASKVDSDHAQYRRYCQLRKMVKSQLQSIDESFDQAQGEIG